MEIAGSVAVVTGGGSGIGRALCRRFAEDGAKGVVVADMNGDAAATVASEIGGLPLTVDVSVEADIAALVERAEQECGPIDLFCSNAGIAGAGGIDTTDEEWDHIWSVNLMAHVYAARAVIPRMVERGGGHLLNTASAAGLLTNIGNAPYAVTKHAAVALAEWLAITYGDAGIRVSCLCPQGVRTPMLMGGVDQRDPAASAVLASGELLEPEQVAAIVVQALREERFLILPHPEVADYLRRKVDDPDRWLAGMRRLQARLGAAGLND